MHIKTCLRSWHLKTRKISFPSTENFNCQIDQMNTFTRASCKMQISAGWLRGFFQLCFFETSTDLGNKWTSFVGNVWSYFHLVLTFEHSCFFAPLSWQSLPTQFSSVQSLSHVWLFETPWTAARQASLSITSSRSLHKLMSIESMMPSNHLILCCLLLLLPSIFPSITVFSSDQLAKVMELQLQHQSFQWVFRADFL